MQKTVVQNFLRIPQITSPTLPSTVQMESIRSSTQKIRTTSFDIFETFVYIPFVKASEMTIDFQVLKTVVHNFLRIPQSTFPTLPSTVQMESSRSSTQRMTTIFSKIVETFFYIPFLEASGMTIYLLVQKMLFTIFC